MEFTFLQIRNPRDFVLLMKRKNCSRDGARAERRSAAIELMDRARVPIKTGKFAAADGRTKWQKNHC